MLLAILLVFCLFYKIVSCIAKCVTELHIKLMMIIRLLEMIDQIYSSIKLIVTLQFYIWEEATKGNHFQDHNRLVKQVVQRLLTTVNRA